MAQSPEYPDLKWMPPKSWTDANRTSVQLIVIHDTEGSAHGESAEDGAAYDQRRTDGTSTHYFVDNNSIIQCVRTADQAHAARTQGNRRGIQYELCAKASFTKAQWLSADYGRPMLQRAAAQVARDCRKWGIPVRKLTPSQVAAGTKGICGHADVTKAFPQDNGTHTDPGPNFPWAEFIEMVNDEGDDMPTADEIAKAVWGLDAIPRYKDDGTQYPADQNPTTTASFALGWVNRNVGMNAIKMNALASAVSAVATGDAARAAEILNAIQSVDEEVLKGLGSAGNVDAIVNVLKETLTEDQRQEVASALITGTTSS